MKGVSYIVITNKPNIVGDKRTDGLRAAIEHRATWFYLMIKAARERGLDASFAREAIFNCGCFHGENKFPRTSDIKTFADAFANENAVEIFEMDVKTTDEALDIDFHYCPLVEAWRKLGVADEDVSELCDIAMEGDRGIVSKYGDFEFKLGKTIAQGNKVCEIRIYKK